MLQLADYYQAEHVQDFVIRAVKMQCEDRCTGWKSAQNQDWQLCIAQSVLELVVTVETSLLPAPCKVRVDWGEPVYMILNWRAAYTTLNYVPFSHGHMLGYKQSCENLDAELETKLQGLSPHTLSKMLCPRAWSYTKELVAKRDQDYGTPATLAPTAPTARGQHGGFRSRGMPRGRRGAGVMPGD